MFSKLFQQAFQVGKRVRTETGIGNGSTSIPALAVHRADTWCGGLDGRRVCVVGAGDMGALVCQCLSERAVGKMFVANRDIDAARDLAASASGTAVPFDELATLLHEVDVVFSATSAPGFVITAQMVREAMSRQGSPATLAGHRLLLVDLALPRDVDSACADIPGVEVRDLDALDNELDDLQLSRLHASSEAQRIIREESMRFSTWMQEREVAPTIAQIYEKTERVCEQEFEVALHELETACGHALTQCERDIVFQLARGVGRKIIHGPTIRLKREAADGSAWRYTDAARYLFGLDSSPLGRRCRSCPHASKCRRNEGGPCLAAEEGR